MEDKEIFEMLNDLKKEWEFFYISDRERKMIIDYITNLQTIEQQYSALLSENAELENRKKELEQINEEHRKINGKLRKAINDAIKYIESYNIDFENCKFGEAPISIRELEDLLNILQERCNEII